MNVDARKPKNDPIAAVKACGPLVSLNTNSPISAPTKGPIKIPKGIGARIPTMSPMVVPHAPALLPPKSFGADRRNDVIQYVNGDGHDTGNNNERPVEG